MARVVFSPKSLDDIESISNYICDSLYNPPAATRIVGEIFRTCDLLSSQPNMGAQFRSELPVLKCYRHVPVENYLVVYRFHAETVSVVRVLHRLQNAIETLLGD